MRWDGLRAANIEAGAPADGAARAVPPLPLALAGGVARTFDTPGFAGMTFYEIRAKSIINKVAAGSRLPFQWTVNPYRGCSHACAYCLSGDTAILMADGRTKPLAEVRVGDQVYGTVRSGTLRHYVPTPVLAHWSTQKPAYRVTLGDGTTLVASGDHRFLTDRGWKFVTGSGQRPRLHPGDRLMGTGDYTTGDVKVTDAYRRGYLCGIVRGVGLVGSYTYAYGTVHRFRLASTDLEALERTHSYLAALGIDVPLADLPPTSRRADAKRALCTSAGGVVEAIRELVRWPLAATAEWRAGFLAGIFDAEGSHSQGVLRIASTDREIIEWTVATLQELGFTVSVDPIGRVTHVRVRGGLGEHLRFLHLTDPAITHKRTITGRVTRTGAGLAVATVEPLGLDLPMFDITTGTADFVANGVISHNCFARRTHEYLDMDSGHDFDTRIVVKVNAPDLLRRELAAPRWAGGTIAMGTNVDCYQRAEGRYRLMPGIIAALRDFANPFSILTKGTLILRDLPLLVEAARVAPVSLAMSVGFVDEALWRSVEPGTPSPRRRLDAVRALRDAGFPVTVLMAPILPGLTDTEESVDATVAAIAAAGATAVMPIPLHLRPGAREWYRAWLARERPELVGAYRRWYGSGSYLGEAVQREITARVRIAARRHGLDREDAARATAPPARPEPPRYEQLTLV